LIAHLSLKRSYIRFTVHWLNQNTLNRDSRGLACRRMFGKHTYDNIAEMIDKVLSKFNIENKTTLIVTDNLANFVKAFRYSTYYNVISITLGGTCHLVVNTSTKLIFLHNINYIL